MKTKLIQCAATVLAAWATVAMAAPTYSVTEFHPELKNPSPIDINNHGSVLLGADNDGGQWEARLCTPAKCRSVPALPTGRKTDSVVLQRLNKAGQLVGFAPTKKAATHALLFDGEASIDLGAFAEDDCGGCSLISLAFGINDKGQIVGSSQGADGEFRGFLWEAGAMTKLPTLGGGSSAAYAINRHGTIVGDSSTGGPNQLHGFAYKRGEMFDLGVLGTGDGSTAYDVNNLDQIVGISTKDGPNLPRAFIYRDGAMTELPMPPGTSSSVAYRINDAGWVIGGYRLAGENDGLGFVYDGTATYDLNDTLSVADQAIWTIRNANGLNASGQILVSAKRRVDGILKVLVLTPQADASR